MSNELPKDNNIIYVSQNKSSLETNYKSGYPLITSTPHEELLADLHSDDSSRSWKTGVMDLNLLREDVYSTDLSFAEIEYSTLQEILKELKNRKDGGFYASVFNLEKGMRVIYDMYRSDRKYIRKDYIEGWRFDLTVSIIEK